MPSSFDQHLKIASLANKNNKPNKAISNNTSLGTTKDVQAISKVTRRNALDIKEELRKCYTDPIYFINNYCYTQSTVSGGVAPFKLWHFQEEVVRGLLNHQFNIILKARQMGISWVSSAFALWFMLFNEAKTVLSMADKLETSKLIIDKVKFMIEHLPEWMKNSLGMAQLISDNKLSIELPNKSKIVAVSTTERSGRAYSTSLLIADECAYINNATETWRSIAPSLGKRGRAILLSTPNGIDDFFYKYYIDAEAGLNGFNPICLGWELHPDRDPEKDDGKWARNELATNGITYFRQEYACQFLGSGETMIDSSLLMKFESDWIQEPVEKGVQETQGLWIWVPPVSGHKYIVSVDISSGAQDVSQGESSDRSKTDFSACVILDTSTNEIVAEYYGKIRPSMFAKILYPLCNQYNKALFVFENNAGWSLPIYDYFMEVNYTNIYHAPKENERGVVDFKNTNNKAGFATTVANRNKILEHLRQGIETQEVRFYSKRFLNELKTFTYNPNRGQKGGYEATHGHHDDLMMAMAICWYVKAQYGFYYQRDMFLPLLQSSMLEQHSISKQSFFDHPLDHIYQNMKQAEEYKTPSDDIVFIDKETGIDTRQLMTKVSDDDAKKALKNVQKSIFENFVDKDIINY